MEELAEVYLYEGETRELIETGDSSKCGEVFRSNLGKYFLCCLHCNSSFICLIEFSQHIEEHFQLISIATLPYDSKDVSVSVEPQSIDQTEETEFKVHEIPLEDDHLVKKPTRKKTKLQGIECDNPAVRKTATKPKVATKTAKALKEPRNNIWICDICGKIFSTKNHIYQHMKLHRKAPKEHKCFLCGWEFYEKGNLTRHLRTHSNDPKAFKCDVCNKGKAYIQWTSLQ